MTSGPLLFVHYAWPPNLLGYCGPDDAVALGEHAVAGVVDRELRGLVREFEGAWPYLELIASSNNIRDPLDGRVVEAYWLGNSLLRRVPLARFGASLDERFRRRTDARGWTGMTGAVAPGARPHHSFHVLAVFPWIGLLRGGSVTEPLRVLDACRIRSGVVVGTGGGATLVRTDTLTWDGARLGIRHESVTAATWPPFLAPPVEGDLVSLHWDHVCDRVTPAQITALRTETIATVALVNASGPRGRPRPL